jgi:hypothetical protein
MSFEAAAALALARSYGRCEGCGIAARLDPHHRMTRGSGGVHGAAAAISNDVRNILMLCRPCHDTTLNDASGCIKIGWVIERRSGTDPLETPALIRTVNGHGWWYLTEDGGYRWSDEMNLTDQLGFCEHGIPIEYCGNCHESMIENDGEKP